MGGGTKYHTKIIPLDYEMCTALCYILAGKPVTSDLNTPFPSHHRLHGMPC